MTKEEVDLAYKLTIENGNKFTKELFQENIQKFRNLLQSSVPYNTADFPNFLKKLSTSKLFGIHLDSLGNQYGVLRDPAIVEVLHKLPAAEYQVYCTIESAGNRGIWTADIRKITGYLIHQVQRAVKHLCDGVRLIKPVTNIHHKNRKSYILANLEPSIEITGGSFYLNGEFNELLVEKLQEQIGLFLSKNQGSNLVQISQFLKSSNMIQGELLDEDVSSVLKLLILEDKIYSAPVNNGAGTIYIWCGGSTIRFAEQAFGIPCFKCDVYNNCHLGSHHVISPTNCAYLSRWLNDDEN